MPTIDASNHTLYLPGSEGYVQGSDVARQDLGVLGKVWMGTCASFHSAAGCRILCTFAGQAQAPLLEQNAVARPCWWHDTCAEAPKISSSNSNRGGEGCRALN